MSNQSSVQWQAGDTILDLYRVIGSLGQGEFGEVYRVRHLGWNLDLAVYSLQPSSVAAIGGKEAFERAAAAWINLEEHPHLASCYYARRLGENPLVFTEYVSSGTLQQLIQSRRLYASGIPASLRRILDLATQIAWGLQSAHEQGAIHRSLTPDTVLITGEGTAKLTQIGLAGPPTAYQAPEQAEQARLTIQTDLWGWGLTVLEMFVGARSWTSGMMAAQALEDFLEGRSLDGLGGDLGDLGDRPRMPAALAHLLRQCFQINPDDRPASAQAVAEELRTIYQTATGSPYPRQQPFRAGITADALNNRALAFWDLGQPDEALRLWEQALAMQPNHLNALYNRGLLRWRAGGSNDLDLLNQLEAYRPQPGAEQLDGQTDYLLSLVHLERGDYETALRLLQGIQAKGLYPETLPALLERVQQQLPDSRRLLPEFSERVTTFQHSISHRMVSLTVNPSGRFAVSGGDDQTIRLWDITTGRCMYTFRGHQGQVSAVTISADGSQLLSGSQDKTLKLWSIAASTHLFTFGDDAAEAKRRFGWLRQLFGSPQPTSSGNGHKGTVRSVAFSADRRYLLSGGEDAAVKLWDAITGKCLQTLREHHRPVFAVAFGDTGRYALSASEDQTIKLWDISLGQVVQTFQGHHLLVAAAYAPSGQFVLAGDTPMKLWDVSTGQVVQTFDDPGVQAIAFSPDSRYVFSGGKDGRLRMWEVSTGRCLHSFVPHEASIQAIAVSPDGRYALSTDGNSLRLWAIQGAVPDPAPLQLSQITAPVVLLGDRRYEQEVAQAQAALMRGEAAAAAQHLRTARSQSGYQQGMEAVQVWMSLYAYLPRPALRGIWQQATLERHTAAVLAVAVSSDGRSILSGSVDLSLKRWDLATERCILSLKAHKGAVEAIAFHPEGTQVLSGSADQTIALWDVNTGESMRTLSGHQGAVRAIAFHPKGRYAVSGSNDQTLKLWDVATGRSLRTMKQHRDAITSVAVSPDGQLLLSGSVDQTLILWTLATGELLRLLEGHRASVNSVAISPDGRYAVSGSDDQTLKLWVIASGECLQTLTGHAAPVRSVAFSPDGRYILSGSDDCTLKLWSTAGECLQTLTGHTAPVRSVAFSVEAGYAVSGSEDRTLKLWLLDWELADRYPSDWDEVASPYIENFLTLQTPSLAPLPDREADSQAVTQALTPQGTPTWSEADLSRLLQTLQRAGYGWLRPEGVRQQLISRTRVAAQSVPQNNNAFATAFGTEFATAFGTDLFELEPEAKVILTVTEGTLKGQEFIFTDRTVCIIGRAKDCHLALPNDDNHKTVSRYHCLLDINPPDVRIRDLGSLHGTYLNGQIIGRRNRNQTPEEGMQMNLSGYDLQAGDEIKLGKTVFRIAIEAPQEALLMQSRDQTFISDQTAIGERPMAAPILSTGTEQKVLLPAIAGYTAIRQLSSEDDTETYLARRAETEELVTLKLIQPEKSVQPGMVDTFIQTVSPLKRLQHPHLVRLHEVGYFNGTFFFVSDYWQGSSVTTRMKQSKLSSNEAVAITLQALDALAYAHHSETAQLQGLIHGALNPSAIVLSETGKIAKISDYGIATALRQAGFSGFSGRAAAEQIAFMPRQQAIDFKYAQPDSDVWATAACLYYMLTGTTPRSFTGKDPYLVVLQTDPVPIRQRNAAIPQSIAELVDLALVDNPTIYFKNAAAFKQALASVAHP
ncbi:protein kinase [Phormidium tenue FACHB-886]|nr:protein kinase [Phormidium tenue FACHB-886]